MDIETTLSSRQSIITSGLADAYEYTLEKLCKLGLPIDNYFELCASYILEYEKIKHNQFLNSTIDDNNNTNEDNIKGIEIKVNISSYEQMLPIWVTKNQRITLTVKNLAISSFNLNTKSHNNIYYQPEYPTGLLLARIGNLEVKNEIKDQDSITDTSQYSYFLLTENNTQSYTSPYTGPLFIVYNTEQTIVSHQTHHSITLIVKNVLYKPQQEIYKSLGLKYYHTQTEEEKKDCFIQIINLVRSNPSNFAKVFLSQMTQTNKSIKDLYESLIQQKEIPLLNYSNYIYQHLQIKTKAIRKLNQSSQALMISSIEPSLQDAISGLEECITIIKNEVIPLQIIISLLIDEEFPSKRNRHILLNPSLIYYASSISLVPSSSSDYFCIQEFCSGDTQMFS